MPDYNYQGLKFITKLENGGIQLNFESNRSLNNLNQNYERWCDYCRKNNLGDPQEAMKLYADDRGPKPEDVYQDKNGSCYILSVLRSMAAVNPDAIRNMVTMEQTEKNGRMVPTGYAVVHFWAKKKEENGETVKVPFDVRVSMARTDLENYDSRSMEALNTRWPSVIEKAFFVSMLWNHQGYLPTSSQAEQLYKDYAMNTDQAVLDYDRQIDEFRQGGQPDVFIEAISPEMESAQADAGQTGREMKNSGSIEESEKILTRELLNAKEQKDIVVVEGIDHAISVEKIEQRENTVYVTVYDQFMHYRDTYSVHDLLNNKRGEAGHDCHARSINIFHQSEGERAQQNIPIGSIAVDNFRKWFSAVSEEKQTEIFLEAIEKKMGISELYTDNYNDEYNKVQNLISNHKSELRQLLTDAGLIKKGITYAQCEEQRDQQEEVWSKAAGNYFKNIFRQTPVSAVSSRRSFDWKKYRTKFIDACLKAVPKKTRTDNTAEKQRAAEQQKRELAAGQKRAAEEKKRQEQARIEAERKRKEEEQRREEERKQKELENKKIEEEKRELEKREAIRKQQEEKQREEERRQKEAERLKEEAERKQKELEEAEAEIIDEEPDNELMDIEDSAPESLSSAEENKHVNENPSPESADSVNEIEDSEPEPLSSAEERKKENKDSSPESIGTGITLEPDSDDAAYWKSLTEKEHEEAVEKVRNQSSLRTEEEFADAIPYYSSRRSMGFEGILDKSLNELISETKNAWNQNKSAKKNQKSEHDVPGKIRQSFISKDMDTNMKYNDSLTYAFRLTSNAYLKKHGSYYKDADSYESLNDCLKDAEQHYRELKKEANTAAIKSSYYDERLHCEALKKKTGTKGRELVADPLDGLYGPDGTLSLLSKLLASGEKKGRRSSAEYENICKDVRLLNINLTRIADERDKYGYFHLTAYKTTQMMLRKICEESSRYISKRQDALLDESSSSYKGWRVTLMREVFGRMSARAEAVTAFTGRISMSTTIDLQKYYESHLQTVRSLPVESRYQLAERLMDARISAIKAKGQEYDYRRYETECNELYTGLMQMKGTMPEPQDADTANAIIQKVKTLNDTFTNKYHFGTDLPVDLKHKLSKADYREMQQADVKHVNDDLREEYEKRENQMQKESSAEAEKGMRTIDTHNNSDDERETTFI